MKIVSTLLIFIVFFTSCNQTKKDKVSELVTLEPNAVELSLNDKTSNISRGLQGYHHNGKDYMFNINWAQNSLQMYDLSKGEKEKELFFNIEGDQAIGRIFGFHVHNFDSIFLFTQQDAEIVMIDTGNVIKHRIHYETPDIYSNAFVHNAYFISYPILIGDNLIVKSHLQGNYRQMTDQTLEQKPITYSINVNTSQVQLSSNKYPADYLNEGLKFYEYSMAGNLNKRVFSFFGDHRLFYVDADSSLQSKEVKSKYLDDKMPLFPMYGERENTYDYLLASDHYESILYDKFRNIYYRFAFPKQQYEGMEELTHLKEAANLFSVMVLDENLNILEEILFDEKRHLPNNVFVGKEGLYISTSHPDNPVNKEDKMVFDLLKVHNE
jgi:hypothetical protein